MPIVGRLALPLVIVVAVSPDMARAQNAFPAPLPGQQATPPSGTLPVPPTVPSSPFSSVGPWSDPPPPPDNPCVKEFAPLRAEAERRGHLIKEAKSPAEACKLINAFVAAEVKMLKYVETKSAACGIPSSVLDQLERGHKGSASMQARICAAASQKPTFTDPSELFKLLPEPPLKQGTWKVTHCTPDVTRCSRVQSEAGTSVARCCSLLRSTMSISSVSTPISRR